VDLGTAILLGVVALLAINRFLLALSGWHERRAVFWGVQVLNLLAACFMVVYGIPDLPGMLKYANWLVALIFIFHIVQNNSRLVSARAEARKAGSEANEQERERLRAALRAGEEEQV